MCVGAMVFLRGYSILAFRFSNRLARFSIVIVYVAGFYIHSMIPGDTMHMCRKLDA